MTRRKKGSNPSVNRRDFFKSAGAGLLASGLPANASSAKSAAAPESPVRFVPRGSLTQISPNLYLLRDTCNVYVLKNGDRAVLIDFGSGHVLKLLGGIGVTKVEAILHTHHHRDQSQGDARAVAERIPIHVPQHERHLLDDAENFWRNRRIFHLYYVRNDFFTLTRNVPVGASCATTTSFGGARSNSSSCRPLGTPSARSRWWELSTERKWRFRAI